MDISCLSKCKPREERAIWFTPDVSGHAFSYHQSLETHILEHFLKQSTSCTEFKVLFLVHKFSLYSFTFSYAGECYLTFIIKFFDQNTCLSFPKGYSVSLILWCTLFTSISYPPFQTLLCLSINHTIYISSQTVPLLLAKQTLFLFHKSFKTVFFYICCLLKNHIQLHNSGETVSLL